MKNIVVFLVFSFFSNSGFSLECSIEGLWIPNKDKTLSNLDRNLKSSDSIKRCFDSGLCGNQELIFGKDKITIVTHNSLGEVEDVFETKYGFECLEGRVLLISEQDQERKYKIYLLNKDEYYVLFDNGNKDFYVRKEENIK